jgi:hypothetical protein
MVHGNRGTDDAATDHADLERSSGSDERARQPCGSHPDEPGQQFSTTQLGNPQFGAAHCPRRNPTGPRKYHCQG